MTRYAFILSQRAHTLMEQRTVQGPLELYTEQQGRQTRQKNVRATGGVVYTSPSRTWQSPVFGGRNLVERKNLSAHYLLFLSLSPLSFFPFVVPLPRRMPPLEDFHVVEVLLGDDWFSAKYVFQLLASQDSQLISSGSRSVCKCFTLELYRAT